MSGVKVSKENIREVYLSGADFELDDSFTKLKSLQQMRRHFGSQYLYDLYLLLFKNKFLDRNSAFDRQLYILEHGRHHSRLFRSLDYRLSHFLLKKPGLIVSLTGLMRLFLRKQRRKKNILFVGWYGTETVGDKAILAGLLTHFRELHGDININILTSEKYYTSNTIEELSEQAKLYGYGLYDLLTCFSRCDEIVIGGGPLVIDYSNRFFIKYFDFPTKIGQRLQIKCTIGGAGISNSSVDNDANTFLARFDQVLLRDRKSLEFALKYKEHAELLGDPAAIHLRQMTRFPVSKNNKLAVFLRDLPDEYIPNGFKLNKGGFDKSLADYIINLAERYQAEGIIFASMHTFVRGGDDRLYNKMIADIVTSQCNIPVEVIEEPTTIELIVEIMQKSKVNCCMRFHSVLFAHTLDTEFVALDYTFGDKILNYLTDHNEEDKLVSIKEILI